MSGWTRKSNKMFKTYRTKDWGSSSSFFYFISKLAQLCNHHPSVEIKYDTVRIELSDHELEKITNLDVEMAKYIDQYYEKHKERLGKNEKEKK
jgi:4a-hydroxytetrahydrobiopterin dehydratase